MKCCFLSKHVRMLLLAEIQAVTEELNVFVLDFFLELGFLLNRSLF